MSSNPVVLLAPAASMFPVLPPWCVITLVIIGTVLTAIRVIVTQIIRLRATNKITTSEHALRLLEIEDSPRVLPDPQQTGSWTDAPIVARSD